MSSNNKDSNNNNSNNNNNADSSIPNELKDFIFDLHDSVRTSQIPSEQNALYNGKFRELTAKYFEKSAWPSPQAISSECGGDELFLALYKERTLRHLHSIARPAPKDRVEGWHVYCSLFDLLLDHLKECNNNNANDNNDSDAIYILPEWTFDILHEFVYQFQGFCQFRTTTFTNAAKYCPGGPNADKPTPHHMSESMEVLKANKRAWAVEHVLTYLMKFQACAAETCMTAATATATATATPIGQYLGLFSQVGQSRLECLVGDYTSSLDAISGIYNTNHPVTIPLARGADHTDESIIPLTYAETIDAMPAAKVNIAYHMGVCYLMLRRYRDAARVLGSVCATMQRSFKAGDYRSVPGSEQFSKLYDRMIALLAILTHACPETLMGSAAAAGGGSGAGGSGGSHDGIARVIREKHSRQLSKIEAGEEGYEDLFMYACPKFVTPSVPRYELIEEGNASGTGGNLGPTNQDAYKLQVAHFMNEMAIQQTLRKLRSYMKLYTSISLEKLGRLVMEEDFVPLLLAYKHKMRQIETSHSNGNVADSGDNGSGATSSAESVGTVMDIHYFINDGIVHVDEAEKLHRFENYFMSQISQSIDVMSDIDLISVNI